MMHLLNVFHHRMKNRYLRQFSEQVTQLRQLGYHDFQIYCLIKQLMKEKNLLSLNDKNIEVIRDSLIAHISFAQKSIQSMAAHF